MEQQQKHAGLVLQYDKRRYDGGVEIEQIRQIEQQQLQAQQSMLQTGGYGGGGTSVMEPPVMPPIEDPMTESVEMLAGLDRSDLISGSKAGCQTRPSSKKTLSTAVWHGPLSFCVGMVGVLTACLALLVAKKMRNPELLAQGQLVMSECRKAIGKGLVDTLSIPLRVLQHNNR